MDIDYGEYTTALLDFDPILAVYEAGDDLDVLEALEQFGLRLTDYSEKGGGKRRKSRLQPRGIKDNPNELLKFEPYLALMVAHFLNDKTILNKLTDFGWALIDTSVISQKRVSKYSEMDMEEQQEQQRQQDKKRKERTNNDCASLIESQEGDNIEEEGEEDDDDKDGPLGLIKKKRAKVRDKPNDDDNNSVARSALLSSLTKPPASSLKKQVTPSSSSSSSSSQSSSSSSSSPSEKQGSAPSSSLSGSPDTTVSDDDEEEQEEQQQQGEITKQQKQQQQQPPFRACKKSTTTYDSEPGGKRASSSDGKRQPQRRSNRLRKKPLDDQQSPFCVGSTKQSLQEEGGGVNLSSISESGGKPVSSGDQQQPQCSSNRPQMVINQDCPRRPREWNGNYERSKQFKADNGHCRVPTHYDDDPTLGNWVYKQRFYNKKGSLAPDRKEKLNKIGFIWVPPKTTHRHSSANDQKWDNAFGRLKNFKDENGHCRVPFKCSADRPLGRWVDTQRIQYKKNTLAAERIKKLNEIGFDWVVDVKIVQDQKWDNTFGRLKIFKDENGHCRVPFKYSADRPLGRWVDTQRQEYKKNRLAAQRIHKLNEIGFDWDPRGLLERHC